MKNLFYHVLAFQPWTKAKAKEVYWHCEHFCVYLFIFYLQKSKIHNGMLWPDYFLFYKQN